MNSEASPLTMVVLARNEELRLEGCLSSIPEGQPICVLDMASTDRTAEIAARFGARVETIPFQEEFDGSRNLANDLCATDWILFLDADEHLTPDVCSRIASLIESAPDEVVGFSLPYRTVSFGRWIQHAGNWWPSYKSPALLRRGRFNFPGGVHEPCRVDGRVVRVVPENDGEAILHYSHVDLTHYLEKLNRYTSLETKKTSSQGRELDWPSLARRFGGTLGWFYDETNGKRDGRAGWLLSVGSAFYELATDLKLSESDPRRAASPPSAEAFLLEAARAAAGHRILAPPWVQWLRDQLDNCAIGRLEGRLARKHDTSVVFEARSGEWTLDFPDAVETVESKVLCVTHASALDILGGGEVQLFQTLRSLRGQNVVADVVSGAGPLGALSGGHDLVHVFSLHHEGIVEQLSSGKPYVLSPIYWDRAELKHVAPRMMAIAERSQTVLDAELGFRSLNRETEALREAGTLHEPLPDDQKRLLEGAAAILPNAAIEAEVLSRSAGFAHPNTFIVRNGVTPFEDTEDKHSLRQFGTAPFALCVGRIEPNKNQLGLIIALKGTGIELVLIGSERSGGYARLCREWADPTVRFLGPQPKAVVRSALCSARVHCLVGFGETPGLANLEALSNGCPLICGNRSAEREYFGEAARYVDPLDIDGIRQEVRSAISNDSPNDPRSVAMLFTWERTAMETVAGYRATGR